MVFSSNLFLFLFLPVILALYYLIKNHTWRNSILVFASILFYAWGAPGFVTLCLISAVADYFIVLCLDKFRQKVIYKKPLLVLSVFYNLSILGYFKYSNFFTHEFNRFLTLLGFHGFVWNNVLLPIGISFFILQKISYVIDVYRETEKPFYNFSDYILYLLFFPQLIAGPIVRFHEVASQIRNRNHSGEIFFNGIWRFSLGFGKKVIIANTMGKIVDQVFRLSNQELSLPATWLGIIMYAFQIYFDFSGYSDMAIGLGKMFGFNLPENFNRPYISRSITEFWHRWHMSLSRFFKDYLYIPLGGNRCGHFRRYFNLWIVFLLCGLWHGANWTFIIWGIYHGFLLVIEKVFLLKKLEKAPSIITNIFTFFLVLIGWVFFRTEGFSKAVHFLSSMFDFRDLSISRALLVTLDIKIAFIFTAAGIISFINAPKLMEKFIKITGSSLVKGVISIFLLVYSVIVLSTGTFNPFIYFRF